MAVIIHAAYNHLPALANLLESTLEEAMDAGVETFVQTADPLTPVDKGLLKDNKSIRKGKGRREILYNQHYAAYQEFGTSRGVKANLFATQGAAAAEPIIAARLGRFGQ